jgi:hypothetical protein
VVLRISVSFSLASTLFSRSFIDQTAGRAGLHTYGVLVGATGVGHNTPYNGVIDAGADAAVMIEIRRDLVGDWVRLIRTLSAMPMPSVLRRMEERRIKAASSRQSDPWSRLTKGELN